MFQFAAVWWCSWSLPIHRTIFSSIMLYTICMKFVTSSWHCHTVARAVLSLRCDTMENVYLLRFCRALTKWVCQLRVLSIRRTHSFDNKCCVKARRREQLLCHAMTSKTWKCCQSIEMRLRLYFHRHCAFFLMMTTFVRMHVPVDEEIIIMDENAIGMMEKPSLASPIGIS